MPHSTLKKQVEERFNEKFVRMGGVMPQHRDGGRILKEELKSFLLTEINLAVAEALEEVNAIIKKQLDSAELAVKEFAEGKLWGTAEIWQSRFEGVAHLAEVLQTITTSPEERE